MNSKTIISLVIALSVSYPLYSVASTTASTVSSPQQKSEGSVLETLIVLNKNEIAAARLAQKKSSNPQVKKFAVLMIKDHGKNLHKTQHLSNKTGIKPLENKTALDLKNKGKEELSSLSKLKGKEFDKAYIDAMVKGHEEALTLIDGLIGESSDTAIKAHLEATKKHVKHHLEKAEAIQKSLNQG